MSCVFLTDFANCYYSVPGIKKIFLADYIFYTNYNIDSDGIITSFDFNPLWIELDNNYDASTQSEELVNKTLQRQDIGISQTRLSYDKRIVLNQLRDRKLIAVIQDNNDKYWFFGELGIILNTSTSTPNLVGNVNSYTITLQSFSFNAVRELEKTLGDSIGDCITCKCSDWYFVPVFSQTTSLADTQNCVVGDFGGTL